VELNTPSKNDLRRYYEQGWELPLLALCDPRGLRRSSFKYRILPVVDLVRVDSPRTLHVLDVGCGVGTTSILIARRYPNTRFTCIDISEKQIEAGTEYVRSIGLADRFDFVIGDVTEELPALEEEVDYVICCEIIEHLVRPEPMLRHLGAIGDGSTRYIFSVPLGRSDGENIGYRIVGENGHSVVVDSPVTCAEGERCYPFYHKLYTAHEAENLLARCGFVVDKRVFHNFLQHHRLKPYLNRLTGHSYALDRFVNAVTFNKLAAGVIFLCRRRDRTGPPAGRRPFMDNDS
jgi:SAM-dependent methyltransferase